jgi:hypothetical protein
MDLTEVGFRWNGAKEVDKGEEISGANSEEGGRGYDIADMM